MNQKTETLAEVSARIIRDATPATASGATCFVPRYQIDQLRAAYERETVPVESLGRDDDILGGFSAGDLASAAAQGFRDGEANAHCALSTQGEAVATDLCDELIKHHEMWLVDATESDHEGAARFHGEAVKMLRALAARPAQAVEAPPKEQRAPSYAGLLIIAMSVAGALARAGVTDCDDPGEAIDVLRERWERAVVPSGYVLAPCEPDRAMQDAGMDAARQLFGEEIARRGITRAAAIGFFKAMIGARPAGCCAGECDGACDGTPNPCGLTDQQCEAIYQAVSMANITRDVKTPDRKRAIVRDAIVSGAHGLSEVPGVDAG